MANDNTNNNIPPISDESGVVKVWQFKQNADGSLTPASSGGVSSSVDIFDSNGNALNSNGSGALEVAVVSGGGSNPSVGTTGVTAPTSATEIGVVDSTGKLQNVTGLDLTNANAATVAIVDGSGNQITSFGGGTQYATGTAVATPTGTAALGWDGADVRVLSTDSGGQLKTLLENSIPAGTNVIGHVIADSGSTTAVTGIVEVSPTTAANTKTNPFFTELSDGTNVMGAMNVFGTTPGAVDSINANVSLFIGTTVASAAASGVQLVGIEGHAGGVFDAVLGAAIPANAIQVGGSDGTDLRALLTSATGQLHVLADSGSTTVVTGIVEVSPTTAANTKTNPFFTEISDGTNTVTTNSTATSGKFGLDTNILSILGTAPTTAGFLDIQGADGKVFVRQATAANLNATVVGTGTFAVQAAGTLTNNNAAPSTNNQGVLPAVANALGQSWTEGDQVLESVDLHGGQRIISANIPESTASWTNATAGNTALTVTVLGYNLVVVTVTATSTVTGGILTFEGSDTTAFTNAYPIWGTAITAATVKSPAATYNLSANTSASIQLNVSGYAAFRVRLSTVISGTATVSVGISPVAVGVSNTLVSVAQSGVQSSNLAAAVADNKTSGVFLPDSAATNNPLSVADSVYGGAFSGSASATKQGWSKRRSPTVFNTVQATASGNTAVWTPGSGNKFRILKVMVQVTDNASLASGAVLTISFQDATTAMPIAFDIFVPTTAVTTTAGAAFTQELDLGDFGILSAAANNVFNVNLSAALATGNVRVISLGTEE